jgi:hypothetical protein
MEEQTALDKFDYENCEKEISTFVAKLEDPFLKGCGTVSESIVKIDGFKERLVAIYGEICHYVNFLEQDLEDSKFEYLKKSNEIMLDDKDETIQCYSNQKQRDAYVGKKTIVELTTIRNKEKLVSRAKTFSDYISRLLKKLEQKEDNISHLLYSVKYGIVLGELKVKGLQLDDDMKIKIGGR